jgi:hypothetical protein
MEELFHNLVGDQINGPGRNGIRSVRVGLDDWYRIATRLPLRSNHTTLIS